jgi:4-hydroxybenzoate polyprenyltransferase
MSLSASAKAILARINHLLDKAAHHPLMDRIDYSLQYLSPAKVRAGTTSLLAKIMSTPAIRAVNTFTDVQITRVANSAAMGRLQQYAILVRLNRPIGILLLLWPTLISLWIAAEGWPDLKVLIVFVLGVILMRSAGCAINDYADRHIDGSVSRTRNRPLVSGKVSEKEALFVFATLSICAFALVLLMNKLTIMMSFAGVVLAATYPFMKRYHFLPQVHLGAAFGWTVPMAFTAQANELTPVTWLLFFATVLWTTAYDTMYAMADREDDLKIGVKSTAILFGPLDKKIIGIIQAMLILDLLLIGQRAELSGFYYAGVCVATGFAAWQQYLIKDRDPHKCFQAFLNNNWFGMSIFIGVVLDYQFGAIT